MKRTTIFFIIVSLFFIRFTLGGTEYRVCFASFINADNARLLEKNLEARGFSAELEKILVQGKLFTRVLDGLTFGSYREARERLNKLAAHGVIRELGLKDLWIIETAPPKNTGTAEKEMATETETKIEHATARDEQAKNSESSAHYKEETKPDRSETPGPSPVPDAEGWIAAGEYKKKHIDGYYNMLFATSEILLGGESALEFKTRFTAPEQVYGRCYFPAPVGKVDPRDFWHEIWIDGKMQMRTFFSSSINPEWDQIQIWISEDEYKAQLKALGPGEHTVIIWVLKNEYQGEKTVTETRADGSLETRIEPVKVPVRLSKGKFTYIVK